jgi:hypothetical protein
LVASPQIHLAHSSIHSILFPSIHFHSFLSINILSAWLRPISIHSIYHSILSIGSKGPFIHFIYSFWPIYPLSVFHSIHSYLAYLSHSLVYGQPIYHYSISILFVGHLFHSIPFHLNILFIWPIGASFLSIPFIRLFYSIPFLMALFYFIPFIHSIAPILFHLYLSHSIFILFYSIPFGHSILFYHFILFYFIIYLVILSFVLSRSVSSPFYFIGTILFPLSIWPYFIGLVGRSVGHLVGRLHFTFGLVSFIDVHRSVDFIDVFYLVFYLLSIVIYIYSIYLIYRIQSVGLFIRIYHLHRPISIPFYSSHSIPAHSLSSIPFYPFYLFYPSVIIPSIYRIDASTFYRLLLSSIYSAYFIPFYSIHLSFIRLYFHIPFISILCILVFGHICRIKMVCRLSRILSIDIIYLSAVSHSFHSKMHSIPSHRIPFAGAHSIALGPTFNTHSIPFGYSLIPFLHSIPFPFHHHSISIPLSYLSIYLSLFHSIHSILGQLPFHLSIYLFYLSVDAQCIPSILSAVPIIPFHFIYLSILSVLSIYSALFLSIFHSIGRPFYLHSIYSFGHLSIYLSIPFHSN